MTKQQSARTWFAIIIAILAGALMALAGSDGSQRIGRVPVFLVCAALAFAINWLAYIPSALGQTERYYDLTGGISYLAMMSAGVALSGDLDQRALLVVAMVMVWAIRLASFLFLRVLKNGGDSRFDTMKKQPLRFFIAWTLQGLWVLLTAATALVVVTSERSVPLGTVGTVGIAIWAFGMFIEILADRQKSAFRKNAGNEGKFIDTGLWAWSRHPNYFGEIVIWTGMAIVALPVLQGWQWASLISPFFVALLLIRISGIPLLEAKADERWGGQDDYEDYKRRTPKLVPVPPSLQK